MRAWPTGAPMRSFRSDPSLNARPSLHPRSAWNHIYLPIYILSPFPPKVSPGPSLLINEEWPAATLRRGGALLHEGFYDLPVLIPTPSLSQILLEADTDTLPYVVAGPRYKDLPESNYCPFL